MMQLLVCSVAQKCWKVLGQVKKWDPVFSQLPGLTFTHLCSLDVHISRFLLSHQSGLRMWKNRIQLEWRPPLNLQTEDLTAAEAAVREGEQARKSVFIVYIGRRERDQQRRKQVAAV